MNSLSPITNHPRQPSGAFSGFHFAQNRVSHVEIVPSISLLHFGRIVTLLGFRLTAWHNLERWEVFGKLSQCARGCFSPLGVQFHASRVVTRLPRVTTLGRVHYTIGNINRPTSHIKRAIAHPHRDPHACTQSRK